MKKAPHTVRHEGLGKGRGGDLSATAWGHVTVDAVGIKPLAIERTRGIARW